jgi:hypothetical protein
VLWNVQAVMTWPSSLRGQVHHRKTLHVVNIVVQRRCQIVKQEAYFGMMDAEVVQCTWKRYQGAGDAVI